MAHEELAVFNFRTPQGCHVSGHTVERDGQRREFVVLTTEPPTVLRAATWKPDTGKEWP